MVRACSRVFQSFYPYKSKVILSMESRPCPRYPKNAKTLPCLHCLREFHTQNSLKQHVKALHLHVDTSQIDLSAPNRSTLGTITSEHHTLKPHQNIACPACPRRFATQSAFTQHAKARHNASAQGGKGKDLAPTTITTPSAPDPSNEPENLQSLLEEATISPTVTNPVRARADDFIIATYLKEDAVDDGLSYAVRDRTQRVAWASCTLVAALPTFHIVP